MKEANLESERASSRLVSCFFDGVDAKCATVLRFLVILCDKLVGEEQAFCTTTDSRSLAGMEIRAGISSDNIIADTRKRKRPDGTPTTEDRKVCVARQMDLF